MKDKAIGSGKPKGVSKAHGNAELGKGPKGPKESKWAKDAQRNQKGLNDYTELLRTNKQQAQRGPIGLGQITPRQEWQSSMAGYTKTTEKKKGVGRKRKSPRPSKSPAPKGAGFKE